MNFLSLLSGSLVLLLASTYTLAFDIQGEWIQGGMLIGKVAPDSQVQFMGKPSAVSESGYFVIGLGRDAPENVSLDVTENGTFSSHRYQVAARTYNEQSVTGVPQKTVTPPASVQARIARESALVKKARAKHSADEHFLEGFKKPLEGPITGVYGSRRVYNGTPKRPHYGLDIAAPEGTVVKAPAPGVVSLIHADMYFSGGTLIIDHGYGVSSTYIHLSKILVKEGDSVGYDTPVAEVGSRGRSSGPHLDWRVNWFDVRLDPQLILKHFPAL